MLRKIIKKITGKHTQSWESHINFLVKRDIEPFIPDTNEEKPLALIWSPHVHWPHCIIEFFCGLGLKLRGWKVLFAICDGELPHCRLERHNFKKPDCRLCWNNLSKGILKAFNLEYIKFSDYISSEEVEEVAQELSKTDLQGLERYKEDNFEVGDFSTKWIRVYNHGYKDKLDEVDVQNIRRILAGNLLYYRYAKKVLNEYTPNFAMLSTGNTCQAYPGYFLFRERNIRVFGWDEGFGGDKRYGKTSNMDDSYHFSQNEQPVFYKIGKEEWETVAKEPFTDEKEKELNQILYNYANNIAVTVPVHINPDKSIENLRNRFSIDTEKRTLVAFTNISWDASTFNRDIGFENMKDWLFSLIDWFIEHPNDQLIIRVHPGEVKHISKSWLTNFKTSDLIYKKYNKLPQNIIVIPPEDDVWSYILADIADIIAIYTTSIGYEFAARGKRVLVAGDAHFRERGFTVDIKDKLHLINYLENEEWISQLSKEEHLLAKKYAHFFFYDLTNIHFPFIVRENGNYIRKAYFKDLKFLHPDRKNSINTVIDRMIDGKPVLNIPYSSPKELGNFILR